MCDASSSLLTTQSNSVPSQRNHVGPTESAYVRMTICCDQENPAGSRRRCKPRKHSVPASRVYIMAHCHEYVYLPGQASRTIATGKWRCKDGVLWRMALRFIVPNLNPIELDIDEEIVQTVSLGPLWLSREASVVTVQLRRSRARNANRTHGSS